MAPAGVLLSPTPRRRRGVSSAEAHNVAAIKLRKVMTRARGPSSYPYLANLDICTKTLKFADCLPMGA
jgi:hypothetical protein